MATIRKTVLLTGAGGFVGKVLSQQLLQAGYAVTGTTHALHSTDGDGNLLLDICDADAVNQLIKQIQPEYIIHLAAISHVPTSFKDPIVTWQTNVMGTMNLLDAVTKYSSKSFVLFVSSSEVYGEAFKCGSPVLEQSPCLPMNPYAATKLAGELAMQQFFRQGGHGMIARPFNHIGPGQSPDFVTASFAKQVADIESGIQPPIIKVGNLEAYRDFLDVRDVCSAYIKLLKSSEQPLDKRVVNIASGQPCRISEILKTLLALSDKAISVKEDPERLRPSDIPMAAGDSTFIESITDWQAQYSLSDTLLALLNDWRVRADPI